MNCTATTRVRCGCVSTNVRREVPNVAGPKNQHHQSGYENDAVDESVRKKNDWRWRDRFRFMITVGATGLRYEFRVRDQLWQQ